MPLAMCILRKGSWATWQDCKEKKNNGMFRSKKVAQELLALPEDAGLFPITLSVAQNHLQCQLHI